MQITLLSWSDLQLQLLHSILEAQGHKVVDLKLRESGVPLSTLLEGINTDVLIFETLKADQSRDISEIESLLSDVPSLAVLMLCDERDADTLLQAMQAGIREVLNSPPKKGDLIAVMDRFIHRVKSSPNRKESVATTIGFMSCKGGSGATFLATNFASILAKDFHKKTAFLDFDLQCGDAAYYLSPSASPSDIAELTSQIERLDGKLLASSMIHIGPNLDILAAPDNPEANYSLNGVQVERLLKLVTLKYDMVVLDIDHVLTDMTLKAVEMSDYVYVVMENLLPYLRNAKRIVNKLRGAGVDERKIRLVVNRYDDRGSINQDAIEKAVGIKVTHTIPSSFIDIAQAINTGIPLAEVNAKNTVVQVLRKIASEFSPEQHQKNLSWISRITGSSS